MVVGIARDRARPRRRALGALALIALLAAAPARAQIVDTLVGFDDDRRGWSAEIATRFSLSGGNTDVRSLTGAAHVQWQAATQRVRVIGAMTRETASGERTSEQSLGHLRHNYRLRSWLSTLVFGQAQRNPFQRLRTRLLVGTGLRFDVVERPYAELACGAAHMVELEEILGTSGFDTDQRLSAFAMLHLPLPSGVAIDGTSFVQPRWAHPADLRAIGSLALRAPITGPLSLINAASIQYDARPPEGVERTDWKIQAGIACTL